MDQFYYKNSGIFLRWPIEPVHRNGFLQPLSAVGLVV